MPDSDTRTEILEELRQDFRHHLETFYTQLKLAPPYDHLEKAVSILLSHLKAMPLEEQRALQADAGRRWACYRQAFVESGLPRKHRGIIAGQTRSGAASALTPEYRVFLEACVASRSPETTGDDPSDATPV